MRLLLDTHALIWWLFDDALLPPEAREVLAGPDHELWVSSASIWELSIKHKSGKLPQVAPILSEPSFLTAQGFQELAISWAHATRAGSLPLHHKDPFDRLLVAQALTESLSIISADSALDPYGVARLWR